MNMDDHNYRVKRALVQLLDEAHARNEMSGLREEAHGAFEQHWLRAHQLTADDIEECRMTVLRGESRDVVPGP